MLHGFDVYADVRFQQTGKSSFAASEADKLLSCCFWCLACWQGWLSVLVHGQPAEQAFRETLQARPCALRSGHPWPPRFPESLLRRLTPNSFRGFTPFLAGSL